MGKRRDWVTVHDDSLTRMRRWLEALQFDRRKADTLRMAEWVGRGKR